MPTYTIETTYHLPVYRHRTYSAGTPEEACRTAIEDDDWEKAVRDYESSGETYVTGMWEGADVAYRGHPVPIPSHFEETVQRQAGHFEILLGVLKILVSDVQSSRSTSTAWLQKAAWAIVRGEAILAGMPDPESP